MKVSLNKETYFGYLLSLMMLYTSLIQESKVNLLLINSRNCEAGVAESHKSVNTLVSGSSTLIELKF